MLESSLYKSSRVVPRVTLAPFFRVQSPKSLKSLFCGVRDVFWKKGGRVLKNFFFSFFIRLQHQGYQIEALLKLDEENQHIRHLKDHPRAENGLRNGSKFKYLALTMEG